MSVNNLVASFSGYIGLEYNTSWSYIHDGSSGGVTNNEVAVKLYHASNGDYAISRGFLIFNTSSIPSNCTIHSVYLQFQAGYNNELNATMQIVDNNQISNSSLTGTDYPRLGTANYGQFAFSAMSTATGYVNSFAVSPSAIVKGGTTKLGLRTTNDVNNSAPGGNTESRVSIHGYTDSNYPVRLVITYTTTPVVTTGTASALQPISATLAGNVTDVGGGTVSSRGVCWSTSANPTTSNSKASSSGQLGSYTVGATGLLPGTLYHYRAYVTTENSTQYGSDVTFRTPGGAILFNLL